MANNNFHQARLKNCPIEWIRAFCQGWHDVQSRRGWPRGYETATPQEQIGYECGRLTAANVRAAELPYPKWAGDRSGAWEVEKVIVEASEKIGAAIPPTWEIL